MLDNQHAPRNTVVKVCCASNRTYCLGVVVAGSQNGPDSEGDRVLSLTADRGMHSRDKSQSNMSEVAYDDNASTTGSVQGAGPNLLHPIAANGNGNGLPTAETSGRGILDRPLGMCLLCALPLVLFILFFVPNETRHKLGWQALWLNTTPAINDKSLLIIVCPEAGIVNASSGQVVRESAGIGDGEDVEIPWWTYGARGMQLWFPKSLAEPVSHAAAAEAAHYMTDPELEFDREVYPISISLAEVSIIGTLLCQPI